MHLHGRQIPDRLLHDHVQDRHLILWQAKANLMQCRADVWPRQSRCMASQKHLECGERLQGCKRNCRWSGRKYGVLNVQAVPLARGSVLRRQGLATVWANSFCCFAAKPAYNLWPQAHLLRSVDEFEDVAECALRLPKGPTVRSVAFFAETADFTTDQHTACAALASRSGRFVLNKSCRCSICAWSHRL